MYVDANFSVFQHGEGVASNGAKAPKVVATRGPVAGSLNLLMTDSGFTGCRWPTMEDASGHRFCCAERVQGRPYCRAHSLCAYGNDEPPPFHHAASSGADDGIDAAEEAIVPVDQELAA